MGLFMKIVKEHIDEGFVKGEDKLKNLGVGKIELIKRWLEEEDIIGYVIRDDYIIDSPGKVILIHKMSELPNYIQFGKVGGFNCSGCEMTSLKGCPIEVIQTYLCAGNFNCGWNNLSSLEYAPRKIDGAFNCIGNRLRDEEIEKYILINDIRGKVLREFQNTQGVSESFTCDNKDKFGTLGIGKRKLIEDWCNKRRIELRISSDWTINNDLSIDVPGSVTLVEPIPEFIKFNRVGFNDLASNPFFAYITRSKLENLKGCPEEITGNFQITGNGLSTLDFAPKYFSGRLYYEGAYNPINNISNEKLIEYAKKMLVYAKKNNLKHPTFIKNQIDFLKHL